MSRRARIGLIGTGGTISALGRDGFDLFDYDANETMVDATDWLARWPAGLHDFDVVPIPFRTLSSTRVTFDDWKALSLLCECLPVQDPGLDGIVVMHGTATLEETAYFLDLTCRADLPIVVVGSQRPLNGHSTDAFLNLRNAVRVAADTQARGMGVLVVLNDEIHAARDVAKTATFRLQAFRSPDLGVLGHADPDRIAFYRRPLRTREVADTFPVADLAGLPRVDILYAYAGGDEKLALAALAAGAQGIVTAGFAPGSPNPAEEAALRDAVTRGTIVVQSSRAGSGRVATTTPMRRNGFISADNLTPQKARILLALAMTRTNVGSEIEAIFSRY